MWVRYLRIVLVNRLSSLTNCHSHQVLENLANSQFSTAALKSLEEQRTLNLVRAYHRRLSPLQYQRIPV